MWATLVVLFVIAAGCIVAGYRLAQALYAWGHVRVDEDASPAPPAPPPAPPPSRPQPVPFSVQLVDRHKITAAKVSRRTHRIFHDGRAWDHYGTTTTGVWQYAPADVDNKATRQQRRKPQ